MSCCSRIHSWAALVSASCIDWCSAFSVMRAWKSSHNSTANKKPGVTGLSSAMRLSVLAIASLTRPSFGSVAGKRIGDKSCSQSNSQACSAHPAKNILFISSNSRAGGIAVNSSAVGAIASCTASSISKPSLAAKRTARRILTGSSRSLRRGSPINRRRFAAKSFWPSALSSRVPSKGQ